MRGLALLGLATASAAWVGAATAPHRAVVSHRAASPVAILDQLSKAADAAKGAAAEAVVAKKVADKLVKAKEKYNIPESYEPVMQGFFTSYMTQVYKAGKDMDTYEAVLTGVFKKVREMPAAREKEYILERPISLSQPTPKLTPHVSSCLRSSRT